MPEADIKLLRFFKIIKIEKTIYLHLGGEWTYLHGENDIDCFCASDQYLEEYKPELGGY